MALIYTTGQEIKKRRPGPVSPRTRRNRAGCRSLGSRSRDGL